MASDKTSKSANKTTKENEEKINKSKKPNKNYSLIRTIRKEKLYKSDTKTRDNFVRKLITEDCKTTGTGKVIPGQLVYFHYFEPKTKEELAYYDAKPLTIFFGRFQTEQGIRIMGFNIHYYPPKIRYQIMDRIMEIWKPMYLKSWETGIDTALQYFDYKWLQMQLVKAGLGFGVRMYIPELTTQVRIVPPKLWSKAVFTEGVFKKQTRAAILNYWKNFQRNN